MRDEADIADDADGGIAIGEYAFALGGEVHEIGHYFARPNFIVIPTAGDASVPTPHNPAPPLQRFWRYCMHYWGEVQEVQVKGCLPECLLLLRFDAWKLILDVERVGAIKFDTSLPTGSVFRLPTRLRLYASRQAVGKA